MVSSSSGAPFALICFAEGGDDQPAANIYLGQKISHQAMFPCRETYT